MFGYNLKQLRKKCGFTQKEIADMLHISAQSVSKWESDEATPSIEYLPELAKILNCSIDDFFKPETTVEIKFDFQIFEDFDKTYALYKNQSDNTNFDSETFEDASILDSVDKELLDALNLHNNWRLELSSLLNPLIKQRFVNSDSVRNIYSCDSATAKSIIDKLTALKILEKVPEGSLYCINESTL